MIMLGLLAALSGIGFTWIIMRLLSLSPLPRAHILHFLTSETNQPIQLGHRGIGADSDIAPENTLEAIEAAHKRGLDGVEFDISFTKDGVAVLLHDPDVSRTTFGSGNVADMTYEEVLKLRFRGATNAHIPTVDEAVKLCLSKDLKILFDVKGTHMRKTVQKLDETFTKYPALYDKAFVSSFNPIVIYMLRWRNSKIITGTTYRWHYIAREDVDGPPRYGFLLNFFAILADKIMLFLQDWLWRMIGNSIYICKNVMVDQNMVLKWKSRGITVMPWSVNNPEQRQYFRESLQLPIIVDEYLKKT